MLKWSTGVAAEHIQRVKLRTHRSAKRAAPKRQRKVSERENYEQGGTAQESSPDGYQRGQVERGGRDDGLCAGCLAGDRLRGAGSVVFEPRPGWNDKSVSAARQQPRDVETDCGETIPKKRRISCQR